MRRLSRRQLLKSGSAVAAGLVLSTLGCTGGSPLPTTTPTTLPEPTLTPAASSTPGITPSATLEPTTAATAAAAETATATATPVVVISRGDMMKHYPDAPSKVVRTHHSGVWSNKQLVPNALSQMLDATITQLTGVTDAIQAWKTLFDPGENIAIKVNTIFGSIEFTKVPLVMAVVDRLQAAGIPPEQIMIFDRSGLELQNAGYTINKDGPGVHCYGTDSMYTGGFEVVKLPVMLSNHLMKCDALINMPLVKQHAYAGVSFAMKNHYGTIDSPSSFHYGDYIKHGISEINALAPIKDRTRLIIGDALKVVLGDSWTSETVGDSIFMSFDPVAHDTAGLQVLVDAMKSKGKDPAGYIQKANAYLASAFDLGLGTNDPAQTDVQEIHLS
jgi:uncharacterized protein (DUF362 family)